jgi:hypothetical protein
MAKCFCLLCHRLNYRSAVSTIGYCNFHKIYKESPYHNCAHFSGIDRRENVGSFIDYLERLSMMIQHRADLVKEYLVQYDEIGVE